MSIETRMNSIREVRRQALEIGNIATYALMVFDCVMLQLGGLGVQSRGNKIHNPREALRLSELAAAWLSPLVAAFDSEHGADPER